MAINIENGYHKAPLINIEPDPEKNGSTYVTLDVNGYVPVPAFQFRYPRQNTDGNFSEVSCRIIPSIKIRRTDQKTPSVVFEHQETLLELPEGHTIRMQRGSEAALWAPQISDIPHEITFPDGALNAIQWRSPKSRDGKDQLLTIYTDTEVVVRDPQPESQEKVLVEFK